MKLGLIREIDNDAIALAKSLNLDGLIYLKIAGSVKKNALLNYKLIDAYQYDEIACDRCYTEINELLKEMQKKIPSLFIYKYYDLFYALLKDIYWSVLDDFIMMVANEKMQADKHEVRVLKVESMLKNRISIAKKCINSLVRKPQVNFDIPELKNKIGARVDNLFCLENYGYLPETIGVNNFFAFWRGKIEGAAKELLKKRNIPKIEWKPEVGLTIGIIDAVRIPLVSNPKYINLVLIHRSNLISAIEFYEAIAQKRPRALIVDAGECQGEGILLHQIAKKYKFLSVNIMNGTKIGKPSDKHADFDVWVMHNEMLQKVMSSYCELPKDRLPVLGHLGEDIVKGHRYLHTLDQWLPFIKDKVVVSLFTSTYSKAEKKEVMDALIEILQNRNDIVVLIRSHPFEFKNGEVDIHSSPHERMKYLPEHDQPIKSLYDLLYLSDMSISFASAVMYQSSWFGITTITYEHSEKSKLIYTPGKNIVHVNNKNDLNKIIQSVTTSKKKEINQSQGEHVHAVAKKIANHILQHEVSVN